MNGTEPSGQIAPQFRDLWNQLGKPATKLATGQAVKVETFTPDIAEKKIGVLYFQLEHGTLDRPTAGKEILQLHTWSLSHSNDLSLAGRIRLQSLVISMNEKTSFGSALVKAFICVLKALVKDSLKPALSNDSFSNVRRLIDDCDIALGKVKNPNDQEELLDPFVMLIRDLEGLSKKTSTPESDKKLLTSLIKDLYETIKTISPSKASRM